MKNAIWEWEWWRELIWQISYKDLPLRISTATTSYKNNTNHYRSHCGIAMKQQKLQLRTISIPSMFSVATTILLQSHSKSNALQGEMCQPHSLPTRRTLANPGTRLIVALRTTMSLVSDPWLSNVPPRELVSLDIQSCKHSPVQLCSEFTLLWHKCPAYQNPQDEGHFQGVRRTSGDIKTTLVTKQLYITRVRQLSVSMQNTKQPDCTVNNMELAEHSP